MTQQISLIDTFETSRAPNPLFCHQEFLEKLAAPADPSMARRAVFLMQRLAVDARRLHYKPTYGSNRGWRRSRLGGNHGSHFYAWWAPKNAPPLKEGFSNAPEGALFLRDIRHHDDHSLLPPQSFEEHYLPLTVSELRREEYGPAPWTAPQSRFATARQAVRVLKGHPGSGKTTALWHAADSTGAARTLYVTYSRDLATLARDYFDRYCSSLKQFHVITFPQLIRQLLGINAAYDSERELRQRFVRDLAPFGRSLGVWTHGQTALYDEFYAHLVGAALPAPIGRFAASKQPRVPDKPYRESRARSIGSDAVTAALAAAARLERQDAATLADRYFPELALAWRAVERLRACASGAAESAIDAAWLDFGCIAVDEAQDLSPIEALAVIELGSLIHRRHGPVSLLWAGDEAQTVRPTDFEWGWLNDLLRARIATPSEYKLSANLRSPRRIAEIVNRVWDLYSLIQKQERPRGAGNCEIDDDATDQILYCTAAPGAELNELLVSLAAREGLALITLEEAVPAFIPEPVRPAVLTVSEAKGLDFHSVCVIDAGRHIEGILREEGRLRAGADLEGLRKRLAIDQLRVAVSRPTERLLWLDISPSEKVVRASTAFLNGGSLEAGGVSSSVPAAVLKILEEDELDAVERVQRCQADARQYLEVKPEMAWSRAQQAVTLLGSPGSPAAVTDETLRNATYLTLAEICFALGFRNTRLAPELGSPDLLAEAERAASCAGRYGLAAIIHAVERVHHASAETHLESLAGLAQDLPRYKGEAEPWLLLEMGAKSREWVETLEAALVSGRNAAVLIKLLPPLYEALGMLDRAARTARLQKRAIQLLLKDKQFAPALEALKSLPDREPALEAACHEGLGDLPSAATCYREAQDLKGALNCYRAIPDLEAALGVIREVGEHPAAASLEWIQKLQALIAEQPEKFAKVLTAAEKKNLEDLLERSLGVKRRKPPPRKAPQKNVPTVRKQIKTPPRRKRYL